MLPGHSLGSMRVRRSLPIKANGENDQKIRRSSRKLKKKVQVGEETQAAGEQRPRRQRTPKKKADAVPAIRMTTPHRKRGRAFKSKDNAEDKENAPPTSEKKGENKKKRSAPSDGPARKRTSKQQDTANPTAVKRRRTTDSKGNGIEIRRITSSNGANNSQYKKSDLFKSLEKRANVRAVEDCDLDFPKDTNIDNFVFENDHIAAIHWDAKWRSERGKAVLCKANYVVGCTKRKLGDDRLPSHMLFNYVGYARPCWVESEMNENLPIVKEYMQQERILDLVEYRLREELGNKEFDKLYPNRYLKYEKGEGQGRYVKSERSLYVNRLGAVSWRFNYVCALANVERVIVADWTSLPPDDHGLKQLKFTFDLQPDAQVRELLEKKGKLTERLSCGSDCGRCAYGTTSAVQLKCCGVSRMHHKHKQTGIRTFKSKNSDRHNRKYAVDVECNDSCGCNPEQCKNRGVMEGRQSIVIIFRAANGCGWTIRAGEEIDKGVVLGYYCGEVTVDESPDPIGKMHDFTMTQGVRLEGERKRRKPFTIRASVVGNESRFFSHSCAPNAAVRLADYDRYGPHYVYPVFRSKKKIMAGEEITFDYFCTTPFGDVHLFEHCKCGARNCRYTPEKIAARRAAVEEHAATIVVKEEMREEEEEGEESSDGDTDQEEESSAGPSRKKQTHGANRSNSRESNEDHLPLSVLREIN